MDVEKIDDLKVGMILYDSWGYDQTQYEFCEILENTGKTLKCRMIGKQTVEEVAGGTMVKPDKNYTEGQPFRLRITPRNNSSGFWLCGSYPYCIDSDGKEHKHRGCFFVWDRESAMETER